jgi:ribose 5-phosphate isomerase B
MPEAIRLLLGGDSAGYRYKDAVLADLRDDPRVVSVEDLGVDASDPTGGTYPSVAIAAATKIAHGDADRAILFCGTGIGVAIAANKVRGIRATVAHDSYSVERSILSNDCQILTMGQRVIGLELARRLAKEWLGYAFDPTSHSKANVDEIVDYEEAAGDEHDAPRSKAGAADHDA